MTNEPWIFVCDNAEPNLGDKRAFVWCCDNLLQDDWDHTTEGYWFKHKQDAIMFSLRWS